MNKVIKYVSLMIPAFIVFLFVGLFTVKAQESYNLVPWEYDPDETGTVVAEATQDSLRLEKNTATSTNAAAGATIYGVDGLSTTGLSLSFDVDGYCGVGAPRFNVRLENGTTVFLGCTYGNDGGTVTFTAGNSYGGVNFPEGETVTRIDIVMDEEGQTTLSNIMVNDEVVTVTPDTLKVQCKNNGWRNFSTITFRNQGQCVSYFMSQRSDNAQNDNMNNQNRQNNMNNNNSSMGQ